MFIIFLLTTFDTKDCYYFEWNLSLMLLIKVFLTKKHVLLFWSLLNMKKLPQFFLCLSCISLGRSFHWQNWRPYTGAGHIGGEGVFIEGQTLCLLLRQWNQTCRTSANIIYYYYPLLNCQGVVGSNSQGDDTLFKFHRFEGA